MTDHNDSPPIAEIRAQLESCGYPGPVGGVLRLKGDDVAALLTRCDELEALHMAGPTTPAVCRALARFWQKMAENMEAHPSHRASRVGAGE